MATKQTERGAPRAPARSARQRGGEPADPSFSGGPRLQPELAAELESGPWDHRWRLAPGVWTTAADPGIRHADVTLAAMLESRARDAMAFAAAPAALDLSCGEGHLAHRLLEWGAARVEGYEPDPIRLRRARLLRDHFALTADELALDSAPNPTRFGPEGVRFEVVALTGAPDLLGSEAQLLALAASATRGICAIETAAEATDAIAPAALEAGFDWVERVRPSGDASPRFLLSRRELLIAGRRPGSPA